MIWIFKKIYVGEKLDKVIFYTNLNKNNLNFGNNKFKNNDDKNKTKKNLMIFCFQQMKIIG